MSDTAFNPTLASVVFIRIHEFTRRQVVEQARLLVQLEAVIRLAISDLPEADRIVLDASDGVAIVVLGNPMGALDAAERCLTGSVDLPLCISVNHGPIMMTASGEDGPGLHGDGIYSAAIMAVFIMPSRVLTSHSFREALTERSPDRAATLRPAGSFSDATIRTHVLFTPDATIVARRRRRLMAIAAVCAVGFLAAGAGLRELIQTQEFFKAPAVLVFKISPRGEIFIDGESKGLSPPLTQIKVRSGKHTVEARYQTYPALKLDVNVESGEQITIKHTFSSKNTDGLLYKLRKKLGFN